MWIDGPLHLFFLFSTSVKSWHVRIWHFKFVMKKTGFDQVFLLKLRKKEKKKERKKERKRGGNILTHGSSP